MGLMCSQPVQGSVPMGNIQLNPAMLPAGMGGAAMNGQPTIIVLAPFGLPAPAAWRAGPTASSPPPPPSSAPASKRAHATIQELITAAVRSKGRAKLREVRLHL